MKSVSCPYCKREVTGDFQPGDMIECQSCKGRFQPPPGMLKEVSVSKETCPFCKTVFSVPASSTSLIQCPSCNGKFSKDTGALYAIAARPKNVQSATILLVALILVGTILHAILFAMGRTNGNWQLTNVAVQRSVAMLPWKMLSVLFAWKLFKGRNWARMTFNLFIPIGILFSLMQAIERHTVNLADSMHADYPTEVVFWFSFFASVVFGIGALCYLNSEESRSWFLLPQERKNMSDYLWWILVLLIVILCPVILFLTAFYRPDIKSLTTKSYSMQGQRSAVENGWGRFSSTGNGSKWDNVLSSGFPLEQQSGNKSDPKKRQQEIVEYVKSISATSQSSNQPRTEKSSPHTMSDHLAAGTRKVFSVGGIEFALRWCPATTSTEWKRLSGGNEFFTMGIAPSEKWGPYFDIIPQNVTLTRGFWLGETEVTVELWRKIMRSVPSYVYGERTPINSISWLDCQSFLMELNTKSPVSGFIWTLPTEAQWEYACRAGTSTTFSWGTWWDAQNGDKANINKVKPGDSRVKDVGSYAPNPWGFYDMHGNVEEWCSDWYGVYPGGIEVDPVGPQSGQFRVVRGGAYLSYASSCCSSARHKKAPKEKAAFLGFRVALVPIQ